MWNFTIIEAHLEVDKPTLSEKLKAYLNNKFKSKENIIPSKADIQELDIYFWNGLIEKENLFGELKKCYPQLGIPLESGIEKSELYKDVVLRGRPAFSTAKEVSLNNPEGLHLEIYDGIGGRVPVLTIADEADFVKIIQSLLHKNNPVVVPKSMGATIINGVNNRRRLALLKEKWLLQNPLGNWNNEFSTNLIKNKKLYKDVLIILSKKPYSNVTAATLELSEDVWLAYSNAIRKEHECVHLFTLKKYGKASNNLHDELIADYIGIIKAIGYFKKEWLLTFLGIEHYPKYRKGARLENYIKEEKFSDDEFEKLTAIIKQSIENLDLFDRYITKNLSGNNLAVRIDTLCQTDLLEMASKNGARKLIDKYQKLDASTLVL